jgi:putative Holliday junction resolvase
MAARGSALGIDHGTKRTGFAVADPLRISILPLETYRGPGDGEGLLEHVASLLAEREVTTFVVGHPLNADGSEGPRAAEVTAFCARLAERFPGVAIARVDERWTTKEAEARLVEAGLTGARRRENRDAWSAVVLLEDWIRSGEPG